MKLTPKQLADRWQVSVRTLERMRVERRGPPWERIGYRVRYDREKPSESWWTFAGRVLQEQSGGA
jgi:predicted DNA-binding transcriptional regulator YafY